MPGWAKALIIVLVVIVVLVIGIIGAAAFWWSRNKDTLIGRAKAVVEEGETQGRKTDNQGCVDAAVSRYKAEPGLTNGISTSIFMKSCLQVSKSTPGFCDDVPDPTEFVKTAEWQLEECRKVDLGSDQYCRQIFQGVQRFCEKRHGEPSTGS
jgi:hypothetical protein